MTIFSFKLPESQLNTLGTIAHQIGIPKGELIRRALDQMFETHSYMPQDSHAITERLLSGSSAARTVDWANIYRAAQQGAPALSPEEEVLHHRRREL